MIKNLIIELDNLSTHYSINLNSLILLYLLSIIPIYAGLYLMIVQIIKEKNIIKVFQFFKKNKKNISINLSLKFLFGLILHIFGWILPYGYILLFSKNFSPIIKIILSTIILIIIINLIRKYVRSKKCKNI